MKPINRGDKGQKEKKEKKKRRNRLDITFYLVFIRVFLVRTQKETKAKKKEHQGLVKRVLSILLSFPFFYVVNCFLLLLLNHVSWLSLLFIRIARKNDSMNYILFTMHE